MLKKLLIEPNYPNSTVLSECNCGFSRTPILSFTNALKNPELFIIKCFFCKKEPKHPLYCIGCRRIYCNTCKLGHNTKIKTKAKHILIDAYKYDFYCAEHQDNLNTAYCLDCQIDICKICLEEKSHEKHIVLSYSKIELDKKQIERIKKNIDISKVKLTKKINMSKVLYGQIKDAEKKKLLKDVINPCYKNNKAILSLVYYFYLMYTEMKEKNYIIIHNLTENIKFNHQPFLLVQTTSLDEKLNDFIDFLKNDFVLFKRYVSTRLKKNNIIQVNKKQDENNNDKENIKENNDNNNEINLIEEEKKEDENNNDKNIIINKDEDKIEEENHEIKIENDSNNEEININIENNIYDDSNKNINESNKEENNNGHNDNVIIKDDNEINNDDIKKDSSENNDNDNNNNIFNDILNDNNNINNESINNEKKRVSIFDINAIINEKYDDEISKEDDEDIDFDIPQMEKLENKSKNNKKEEKNDINNLSEEYFDVTFNPGAVEKEKDNIKEIKNSFEKENNKNINKNEQKNSEEDKDKRDNNGNEDNKILMEENKNNINDNNMNKENEKNSEKIEFKEKLNEEINKDNNKNEEKNNEEIKSDEKINEIEQEEINQENNKEKNDEKINEIKQEEINQEKIKTEEILQKEEVKNIEEIKENIDNEKEIIEEEDNKNEENEENKEIKKDDFKQINLLEDNYIEEEIKDNKEIKNEDIKEDKIIKIEEIKTGKIIEKEDIKSDKENKNNIEIRNEIIINEKTDKKEIKIEEPKIEIKHEEQKIEIKKEEPKMEIKKEEHKIEIKKEEPKKEFKNEKSKKEIKKDESKKEIKIEESKKQIPQNEVKKGINKINKNLLNKFEIKKEPNKVLSKKAITTTNLNSKKALFENKSNQNKISSKQTFPTKKGGNILNNPKFANLAKMMGGRMPNPQMVSKSSTLKSEPLNIITEKENPDQLIMNKPTIADKKKPKKISFEERIKQFES